MCILELGKVLMYEFRFDYNKNKYDNKSNSLIHEIKTEDVYENFAAINKCLNSLIIRLNKNTMMIQTN